MLGKKDSGALVDFSKSQKRRVQRLREREIEQDKAERAKKAQVWQTKQTAVSGRSANINMLCMLPKEFIGSEDQDVYSDFDQSEFEELAAQLSFVAQAIFNRPERHRHLKALYVKGFIDGKPMGKMLVDGGASVNIMPYSTFRKLGKTSDDLIKTDLQLKDFEGNSSETRGAINVELTIGNNEVEVVPADDTVDVASIDAYWDFEDFECFSGREDYGDFISTSNEDQQPIKTFGSESNF